MKALLLILILYTLLMAGGVFYAQPVRNRVKMVDSTGRRQKYYDKTDRLMVISHDSRYYKIKDDEGDVGYVKKRHLKRCEGKAYSFPNSHSVPNPSYDFPSYTPDSNEENNHEYELTEEELKLLQELERLQK